VHGELEGAVCVLPVRGSQLHPDLPHAGWRRFRTKLTEVAADKAVKSQKPRAVEPGRYTVILEPRANARFLSLMMGIFNARTAEGPVGNYFSGKERGTTKVGEKLFSDQFTLREGRAQEPVL
jgi:predicted Zn-dependent protease